MFVGNDFRFGRDRSADLLVRLRIAHASCVRRIVAAQQIDPGPMHSREPGVDLRQALRADRRDSVSVQDRWLTATPRGDPLRRPARAIDPGLPSHCLFPKGTRSFTSTPIAPASRTGILEYAALRPRGRQLCGPVAHRRRC